MTGKLVGIALIAIGLLVAVYGDKRVDAKGGTISKAFSMPRANAKVLKWAIAIISIGLGVALLVGGGRL